MGDQDYKAILEEEFEVLESIFPDELETDLAELGESSVRIRVEPEEASSVHPLILDLIVVYPETYPDVIPELSFETTDEENGELTEAENAHVLGQLAEVATESLGMAMTFTIASAARDFLADVVSTRIRLEKEADDARAAAYEEAERERTRGTQVTPARFEEWRAKFLKELASKREKDEEERVRAMPPKERDDYKRKRDRLSGRQLFEQSKTLATSDEALYEEGSAEVDLSQYSREQRDADRRKEEEEEERRRAGLVGAGDSDEE